MKIIDQFLQRTLVKLIRAYLSIDVDVEGVSEKVRK